MKHLTDQQLSAYLDGALPRRPAEDAARHLAACAPCREALAELAAQDRALRPALESDPGEAYFDRITSYNVCYTKLLRNAARIKKPGLRPAE